MADHLHVVPGVSTCLTQGSQESAHSMRPRASACATMADATACPQSLWLDARGTAPLSLEGPAAAACAVCRRLPWHRTCQVQSWTS